jgi:hypothetical protein
VSSQARILSGSLPAGYDTGIDQPGEEREPGGVRDREQTFTRSPAEVESAVQVNTIQPMLTRLLGSVSLVADGGRIEGPPGLVYSTDPRNWLDAAGQPFVVKGPDLNIVVAESLAYELADLVGVHTPDYAFASIPSEEGSYFASRKVTDCIRDAGPWLNAEQPAVLDQLALVLGLDVWIGNDDRNMGGFLVGPGDGSSRRLIAIDFEKAVAIRGPAPIVSSAMLNPKNLRPTGDLLVAAKKALRFDRFLERLGRVPDTAVSQKVELIRAYLPGFDWHDSVSICLRSRKSNISKHLREVWS